MNLNFGRSVRWLFQMHKLRLLLCLARDAKTKQKKWRLTGQAIFIIIIYAEQHGMYDCLRGQTNEHSFENLTFSISFAEYRGASRVKQMDGRESYVAKART